MEQQKTPKKLIESARVQSLISRVIRGKHIFLKKDRVKGLEYLDIGCGPNTDEEFVNLDYTWNSQIDVCWDLTKANLPFPENTFKGVYTEHCYEHLPFSSFKKNMQDIYRVLKPGGTFRFIVPDGEIYIDIYQRRKNGEDVQMPYEHNYISMMHRINGLFRNHGHLFIFDFNTVQKVLEEVGFQNIVKESYQHGRDEKLLRDTEHRAIESLYVEASK